MTFLFGLSLAEVEVVEGGHAGAEPAAPHAHQGAGGGAVLRSLLLLPAAAAQAGHQPGQAAGAATSTLHPSSLQTRCNHDYVSPA